jgi:hypothetical protein
MNLYAILITTGAVKAAADAGLRKAQESAGKRGLKK